MRIKRVVAQGFKTYAKKTEFIFDPGVTAIVGPNGSGKSNVSDAIRWCLGEQSFSTLRSKKTSDVIFSGSDSKSRLGMAQVTVSLENESGEIPVDFTEVEITRRAYRDGNNEYLLNGQRVRLQDITEILAPTGLGKRTYALIGQGLIERVLSMAPEDLRTLFEEAAGITTHQSKRSAALRRLDTARLNLTRINDISAEISPRLGYLRRQAERTEQRNEIAEELGMLLESWYGYQWHQAQERFRTKSELADELNNRITRHLNELDQLSASIDERREEQSKLRSELSEYHTISSDYHRESERVGRELAVAQERLRLLTERTEASTQELAPLGLQRDTLQERIAETELRLDEVQSELEKRQAAVTELQTVISERQNERSALEHEVTASRKQAEAIRTAIAQAHSQLQQVDDRGKELQRELEQEKEAKAAASMHVREMAEKVASQRTTLSKLESSIAEVDQQLGTIEESIEQVRGEIDTALEARQAAEREVDKLQTRIDVLNRLRREGAGYANGVQAVLQAAHNGQLTGIHGTVASVLRAPAHLDKALETALGGAYQNLIAASWSDAKDAIDFLTKSGRGRATFLPLDRLQVLPAIAAPSATGIIGNAADLVEYDSVAAPAMEQLLNRVWIAENLAAARRALDGIRQGPRPTVVTLEGEIVRPGGSVTGGADSSRRNESLLARERELRELPRKLEQAQNTAVERTTVYQKLSAQFTSLQQELPPIQDQLAELHKQERISRAELNEYEKALERSTQSVDWHDARIVQIGLESSNATARHTQIQEQLQAAQTELISAETSLNQAEQAFAAGGVSDLLQSLADLRASAATKQGDKQSQIAILDNQRRSLQSTLAQIEALEQEIVSFNKESADLSESIAKLSEQEDHLGSQIAEMQAKIAPAEAALEQIEAAQTQTERIERQVQETLRKDEAEWNVTQLSAQRAQDAIDHLRSDIENEFSLLFINEEGEDGEGEAEAEDVQQLGAQSDDAGTSDKGRLAWQPVPSVDVDAIIQRLPNLDEISPELDERVRTIRKRLTRLKNVNPDAPREYAEAAERCEFLETQAADLERAIADLHEVVAKLEKLMEAELETTFAAISEQFIHYFQILFDGGTAKLSLTDSENITMSGIEIVAKPPGKRPQTLALLSGGERTLTACALIFAILRVSPTPFCVLDEVDAALDEANVDRFRFALEELSRDTQFILITHNRRTLEGTNAIYGVTMGNDGISRVISLKLEGERIVRGSVDDQMAESDVGDQLADIEETVEM